MKILLINPPYQTITSNFGVGHQVPLGLLMVGGPLRDAGHEVKLLDAERRRLSDRAILEQVRNFGPDLVMTGHAGLTPAHPVCMRVLRAIKDMDQGIVTVYGGVYPTYHSERILTHDDAVDVIVRGEGEATAVELAENLENCVSTGSSTWLRRRDRLSKRCRGGRYRIAGTDCRSRRLAHRLGAHRSLGRLPVLRLRPGCHPGVCADALTAAPTAASMGSGSTGGIAIRQSWQTKSNVCIATMGSIS